MLIFEKLSFLNSLPAEKRRINLLYFIGFIIMGFTTIGIAKEVIFSKQNDEYAITSGLNEYDDSIGTNPPNIEPEVFESPLDSSPLNTEPEIVESTLDSSESNILEIEERNQLKSLINNYYNSLNNSNYEEAWENFSEYLKKHNLHPQGFISFKNHWKVRKSIKFEFIESQCSLRDNQPSIKVLVTYKLLKGKKETNRICFYFKKSSVDNELLINELKPW